MARAVSSRGLVLNSRRETELIGKSIGRVLREGDVIALIGDLGAGKTALVHGIVSGLDAPQRSHQSDIHVDAPIPRASPFDSYGSIPIEQS